MEHTETNSADVLGNSKLNKTANLSKAPVNTVKQSEKRMFTYAHTQILKGIAILALLFHHLFSSNPGIPVNIFMDPKVTILSTSCKVCVSLFMILSGYGLCESYYAKENQNTKIFVYNHILKLLFSFWFIFAFYLLLSFSFGQFSFTVIYGSGITSILYFIVDFFGMNNLFGTPTLCHTWWFMEAIILCYILFPVLLKLMKKFGLLTLLILYTPWTIYFIYNGISWHTDREIFYFFSFALGVYFSIHNIFNKFLILCSTHRLSAILCSAAVLFAALILRTRLCLMMDPFFAISIIFFAACTLLQLRFLSTVFGFFGKNSSAIFMFHSLFLMYFASMPMHDKLSRYIIFVLFCVCVAYCLNEFKMKIGYTKIVNYFVK